MAKLVVFQTDGSTRDVALTRERITIGRRPDNDICLSNLAVSGEHAAVVTIFADSFLEDLGSTNGTLVNGKAITKHFLRERDEIDVGKHRLVYLSDDNTKLSVDAVGISYRAAVGNLGDLVEHAKPKVQAHAKPSDSDTAGIELDALSAPNGHLRNGHIDATAKLRPARAKASAPSAPAAPPPVAIASLKVMTGTNAGKLIALTKQQTTIGRAGVQVAIIAQMGPVFELKSVEGTVPLVNGAALPTEGVVLLTGDAIDIAGSRLEFVGSPARGTW